ncbi:MAG: hypothetical protein ACREIV_14385, partial [Planctomycetaceae bacterium]
GVGRELLDGRQRQFAAAGLLDDQPGQRVFAVRFGGGGNAEEFVFVDAGAEPGRIGPVRGDTPRLSSTTRPQS